jgi:hypothetical protein
MDVRTTAKTNRRRAAGIIFVKTFSALLLLGTLITGTRVAWWWIHYPRIPDVKTMDPDAAIAYMAGDDFNRLTRADRKRFSLGVVDRMNEKRFGELLMMVFQRTGDRRRAAKNVAQLPREDRDAIADRFGQIFLDKFYQEAPAARKVYLTTFALAQQGEIGQHPERFGLPQPEQIKSQMSQFFTRQPPHTQAEMGQFLTDLRKQRESLGLRATWLTSAGRNGTPVSR